MNCCNHTMSLIYNAQRQVNRGWWCEHCNSFEPAIYRERKLKPLKERKS